MNTLESVCIGDYLRAAAEAAGVSRIAGASHGGPPAEAKRFFNA
jgi:hypothetical protein